jgi:hypothetical protein
VIHQYDGIAPTVTVQINALHLQSCRLPIHGASIFQIPP